MEMNVYFHVQKSLPLDPTNSQLIPFKKLMPYFQVSCTYKQTGLNNLISMFMNRKWEDKRFWTEAASIPWI